MTSADIGKTLAGLAANLGPMLRPPGAEELLRTIAETARQIFDAAACSIALLDEPNEELVFYVTVGAGAENVVGVRVPVHQGIAGYVVTTGQAIAIEDVSADPRFARDVAESTGYVPRSILAAPLETEEESIGVISVLDRSGERGDMELLSLFAHQAAMAIESTKVFADLGRVLFDAAARVAASGDLAGLRDALAAIADEAPAPDGDLAELAAVVADLSELGERERRTAVRLVRDFTEYARSQRPR